MLQRSGLRRLVWALACAVCFPAAASETLDRVVFIQLASSVVKVEAQSEGGRLALGSAVTVAPGIVVTSCHVTRAASSIALTKGALRWAVASQLADLEHDLCLLNAPTLEAIPVRLRTAKSLRVGQRVGAMGFTGGLEMAFREGVVSGLHRLDGSNVIQSSTAFTSGASGGGLFDEDGRLVGILTFRLPGVRENYFSAPFDWIEARLSARDEFTAVAPLGGGPAFWQEADARQPHFLRAASLAAAGKWEALLKLADDWARSDRKSAEPWLARGKACVRLDRGREAAKAFEKAVARAPDSAEAWFNLGVSYFRLGDRSGLRRADRNLRALDPELADDLAVVSGTSHQ